MERWRKGTVLAEEMEGELAKAPNVAIDGLLVPKQLPSEGDTVK